MAGARRGGKLPGEAKDPTPSASPSSGWRRWRSAPFLLLALLAALYCGTGMVQAVDTWISLAAGRHIAAHGVDDADPFSFNSRPPAAAALSPDASRWARAVAWCHPTGWINQNWLTHLILFELADHAGLDSLVALRFAIYLAVAVLLLAACRVQGASLAAASVAVAGALLALRPFAEFRAQDLTNLLASLQLVLLGIAVRRSPRALWAMVPLLALWSNLHGGFIFGLLALAVYGAVALAPKRPPFRWRVLSPDSRRTQAGVALAALAATVVASPFRLANLTHPLAITVGPDAALWRRVNEWLPAIAPGNRLGEVLPFFALLGLTAIVLTAALRSPRRAAQRAAARPGSDLVGFDLGGVALAAAAAAMALRSMRFVPLAAITLAPVAAAGIEVVTGRLASSRGGGTFRGVHRLAPLVAAIAAVTLTAVWGSRFSAAYLGPWPFATAQVSLFERMTWGHRAGGLAEFLRGNRVMGRAFTVWEEGGLLLWHQPLAATSARAAVEVFIDGRAQEAYPAAVVPDYIELGLGGPAGVAAASEGRAPSASELGAMGEWVDARLKGSGVWLALVPDERAGDGVFRALAQRRNWRVAFRDAFHAVLVDTDSLRGQGLDAAVAGGTAAFPDESIRLLTLAARSAASVDPTSRRGALVAAVHSYDLRPSAAAMAAALQAGSAPEQRDEALAFARRIVGEYSHDEARYRRENGFCERATAVIAAAAFVELEATRAGAAAEARAMATVAADAGQAREQVARAAAWWG